MKTMKSWVAAAALVAMAGAAQAALVDRGGGMIYDTTRNITWLADMNYAKTQFDATGGTQGDADGRMTWAAATAWADNLAYGGFDDWRLPTLNPADASCTGGLAVGFGFNCTGGELSGLFVTDLGYNHDGSGLIASDDTAAQIANLALFSNVQSSGYWYGTEYAPNPSLAWLFYTITGVQSFGFKGTAFYAVAVRPGDVAASVPEPQTLALVLLALGATGVASRARRR
jgi:hypothetical protein